MESPTTSRPRMEGDRERQIFLATLELLAETGYDRFTLDAVAARARASKATLYRRWPSKADLILDALSCLEVDRVQLPDTGSLRGDLLALAEQKGLLEPQRADVVCGLATAMYRDPQLRAQLSDRFDEQRDDHLRTLLERARDRGETRDDLDIELLSSVFPALVLFQLTIRTPGELPENFVVNIIDQVFLPAVRRREAPTGD